MTRIRFALSVLLCSAGLLGLASLATPVARAAAPGVALVIGEAQYSNLPALRACALSANSITAALQHLGFTVDEQQDASNGAVFAGITDLTQKLKANPDAPVFVYVCSYVTSFDDRPFMLPVSADIPRPADVLTQGILLKSLVEAVERNTKAPAVVALDAIPAPKAPAALALDQFATGLPPNMGLAAVVDTATGDQPTPFASLLAPGLKGPALESAKLLADLQAQFASSPGAKIAALHLPPNPQYLAEPPPSMTQAGVTPPAAAAPAQPPTARPAAPPTVTAKPAAAPAAAAPPAAAAATASLPDEAQMTDAQRQTVQQALAKLGYYDGKIDGIFGPNTRAAIRRFQFELHATMTGHLTAAQATQLVNR